MLMNFRVGPPFVGCMLMNSRRRPPLWLMNSRGGPPFLGCMLMNSRGKPPILRGGLPLGTISYGTYNPTQLLLILSPWSDKVDKS